MSAAQKYTIEIDNLAVGLTRLMVFGVMLEVAFFNLMLCTLGYLYLRSIWIILLFGILHLVALRISLHGGLKGQTPHEILKQKLLIKNNDTQAENNL